MKPSQALVRFLGCMVVGWLFMYLVPMSWFLTYFLPMSFFLLFGLVVLGVVGLGWPFSAPGGFLWKPGMSRMVPGVAMSVLWIVLGVAMAWFEVNVWPKVPLFPVGIWFGIGVFMVTLWFTFDGVGPHLFAKPVANVVFAAALILVLAAVIFKTFVNFSGTPLEGAPADPHGLFNPNYWFGLCVWIIVWIQAFGGPMCLQGWPFYKLPRPLYPVVLTVVVVVLGYACWEGTLAAGMSPTFSFGAIGASMIGWSLMHSVAFEMFPVAQFIQPKRGVLNFLIEEIVLTAVWIAVLRVILAPMLPKVAAAGFGEAFDINALSAFYTLHVTAIALLVHQFFFMRAPLSIPGPPLGPEELPPPAAAADQAG